MLDDSRDAFELPCWDWNGSHGRLRMSRWYDKSCRSLGTGRPGEEGERRASRRLASGLLCELAQRSSLTFSSHEVVVRF